MLNRFTLLLAAALFFIPWGVNAATKDDKENTPSTEEIAEKESDKLGELLKLEDWQIFYVDSTLRHNLIKLKEEIAELQKSHVSNNSLYSSIQDKWMERTDSTFKAIFSKIQWKKYLKTEAGKAYKSREKRKIAEAKKRKQIK